MAQPNRREKPSTETGQQVSALNVVPIRLEPGVDPLDGFNPESANGKTAAPKPAAPTASDQVKPTRTPAERERLRLLLVTGVAALTVTAGGVYQQLRKPKTVAAAAAMVSGRASLHSRPDGATVVVDGVKRGVTPVELELPIGSHEVVFQNGGAERHLTMKIEAGTRMSEDVDLPSAPPAIGQVEVTSDPPGARVTIDGGPAGVTPVTLRNVSAARHMVAVGQGDAIVTRTVEVISGASASVFVSLAGGPRGAGFFAVDSPIELRILENGQLIGLSTAAPLMLRAGAHNFELINEATELRLTRTVTIDAGKTARLRVPAPNGTLSVNASPWAEVFVDGRSIGVTPLGDVQVPVGRHEITWRHPQFGEKQQTVVVGAQTPTRLSVDFRK